MTRKLLLWTILFFHLTASAALCAEQNQVDLGRWSESEIAKVITESRQLETPGERIVSLSSFFIDTAYVENTLIGDSQNAERLVINLAGFDCFTFLDVIEALRRATNWDDFPEQLKLVRYRAGRVAYESRRHFFSDWVADDDALLSDVTAEAALGKVQMVNKQLNLKSDGTLWLQGLPVVQRAISYIPADKIKDRVLSALQPGDYVGIYSGLDGLDVSHTGLIVKEKGSVMLRHASSRNGIRRVVDDNLLEYLQGKAGLVVYRVQ